VPYYGALDGVGARFGLVARAGITYSAFPEAESAKTRDAETCTQLVTFCAKTKRVGDGDWTHDDLKKERRTFPRSASTEVPSDAGPVGQRTRIYFG
jgi:hypothetical protein